MKALMKPALVLGMAGALALGAMTPSEARIRPWAAAGIGLAAGALIAGAAAANNAYYNGYYAPGYGAYAYGPYSPGPVYAPAPAYYGYPYGYDGYNSNTTSYSRERQLKGLDY